MTETAPAGRRLPSTVAELEAGARSRLHLGAQLYVSLAGRPVADLAVGESRPGHPMTTDELMPWLSSTKPVTAMAIGQLCERGDLDLDDLVCLHLPEFGNRGKQRLTVRHLLTHTGGIRTRGLGGPGRSWDEKIVKICRTPLERGWEPGEMAAYHLSSSWYLLGELIQRLSGESPGRFVRRRIFEPLGMLDSWLEMPREVFAAEGARIGLMYRTGSAAGAATWDTFPWHRERWATRCSPGASGRGPARDLGRFYEALLAGGEGVFARRTVETFTAVHRKGLYDRSLKRICDWGLGFRLNSPRRPAGQPEFGRWASPRAYGHTGYQSSIGLADPAHGLVLAFVANGLPGFERSATRLRRVVEAVYVDLGLDSEGGGER